LRWPEFGARCTEEMATGGSGGCNRWQPGQLELRLIGARGRGDRGECMGCSPTVGANGDERKPAGSGRTTASTSGPRGGASPMRFQRRAGALEVWLGRGSCDSVGLLWKKKSRRQRSTMGSGSRRRRRCLAVRDGAAQARRGGWSRATESTRARAASSSALYRARQLALACRARTSRGGGLAMPGLAWP
jgi:hypothetical protein